MTALSKGLLLTGGASYVLLTVWSAAVYFLNVGLINLSLPAIILQTLFGIPFVLAGLSGKSSASLTDWSKVFLTLVFVLGVAGYLAIPDRALSGDTKVEKLRLQKDKLELFDSKGAKRKELGIELAKAKTEEEGAKVGKKMKELEESISKSDVKKFAQEEMILNAKISKEQAFSRLRLAALSKAHDRNALILIAATLAAFGGLLSQRSEGAPDAP